MILCNFMEPNNIISVSSKDLRVIKTEDGHYCPVWIVVNTWMTQLIEALIWWHTWITPNKL